MKILISTFCLFLLFGCATQQTTSTQQSKYEEYVEQTVEVWVFFKNDSIARGTGVVLKDNAIITAKHVLRPDLRKIMIAQKKKDKYIFFNANLLIKFKDVDLAIIKVQDENFDGKTVEWQNALVLDEAYYVGSYGGMRFVASQGIVGGKVGELYYTTTLSHFGASGGGVFNKKTGRCIGILVSKTTFNGSFIIPYQVILEKMEKENISYLLGDIDAKN